MTTIGLFDLFSGWCRRRERKRDIQATAQAILDRYHAGNSQGLTRVDDQLLADMQQHMPAGVAIRIFQEFRTRGRPTKTRRPTGSCCTILCGRCTTWSTLPIQGAAEPPMR